MPEKEAEAVSMPYEDGSFWDKVHACKQVPETAIFVRDVEKDGKRCIDIRKTYLGPDGKYHFTSKGITFLKDLGYGVLEVLESMLD